LDVVEHLLRVATGVLHGAEDLGDDAILADDERCSAGHRLARNEHPELLGDLSVRVREEREVELLLVGELLLELERIATDADEHGLELSKLLKAVTKTARLGRSATGQRFGIEPENDVLLSLQVAQLERLGVLAPGQHGADLRRLKIDIRGLLTFFHGRSS